MDGQTPEGLLGVRHVQYGFMLGLTVLGFGMRIILNVAIVAMTGESHGDYPVRSALGNVIAMPITGAVCASKMGWPLIFYLYGTIGIVWCALWLIFGYDRPSEHKHISLEERNWLESDNVVDLAQLKKLKTPWKAIFTSLPFISVILANAGQNWGFWALLTEIPSYMNDILHYDITSNSNITAIPYLVMFLLNLALSSIADYIIDKRIASLIVSRKIFNSIGFFAPALSLIVLGCTGTKDKGLVITALIIGVGLNGAQYSGFNVNHIDIAPNHASTLMGITNSLGSISSILAPLAVDLIHTISGYSETEIQLWNIDFFLAAGMYISTGIVFLLFGSGEIQSWNYAGLEGDVELSDPRTRDVLRKISVISAT